MNNLIIVIEFVIVKDSKLYLINYFSSIVFPANTLTVDYRFAGLTSHWPLDIENKTNQFKALLKRSDYIFINIIV